MLNSICGISAQKFGLNFIGEFEQQFFCQTLCLFVCRTKVDEIDPMCQFV